MKQLLRELAAQGRTILFSSHVLEVVERICTRICIIDGGRKIAEGTAAEIRAAYRTESLDEAFARLTGLRAASEVTADIIAALDRQ
jgi:ABC-2 type transport system ATP-binding protein